MAQWKSGIEHVVLTKTVSVFLFGEAPPLVRARGKVIPEHHTRQTSCCTIWEVIVPARKLPVPPTSDGLQYSAAKS